MHQTPEEDSIVSRCQLNQADLYITLYKLCAFPVRHIPIPGEAHLHSRWSTSPFPVRHIPIPGEDVHSQWGTSPFPVRICILGEDVHSIVIYPSREWGCASPGKHILTGNRGVPHREWGCASPKRHILTGNAHSLYRVYIKIGNYFILTDC